MSTNFPTSIDSFTTHINGDVIDPAFDNNQQDALLALEAKVGVDGSAVATSHDYKLSGVTATDKAASKTGSETLTNKTLTTPIIAAISNTGTLTLPASTDTLVGRATTDTLTNKTIVAGNNTISGITEAMQTLADNTTQDVTTSKHGYVPKAPNDTTKFLRGDGSWNTVPALAAKSGVFSKDISSTTTETIAHGLGKTPVMVRLSMNGYSGTNAQFFQSFGVYDGTNNNCVYFSMHGGASLGGNNSTFPATSSSYAINAETTNSSTNLTGVITVDGTNITITYTKTGSPTGNMYVVWEVIG